MTDQKHTIGNIVQLTTGQVGDTTDEIWINESEELSNLRAQLNVVKKQWDELREAIKKIDAEWLRQKGLFLDLSKDGWMDLLIDETKTIVRNQEALTKTKESI